jgi:hypothetical protein
MPTEKKAPSKRELIEPTKGDKRYVRRKADGTFGKTVDVGKSLAEDRKHSAKTKVPKGQGDRGGVKKEHLQGEIVIREAVRATWRALEMLALGYRGPGCATSLNACATVLSAAGTPGIGFWRDETPLRSV